MKLELINGIQDADHKKEIRQSFKAAIVIRKRLSQVVRKRMDASWKKSFSEEEMDNPNWAAKQAYSRGKEAAYAEILSLLEEK